MSWDQRILLQIACYECVSIFMEYGTEDVPFEFLKWVEQYLTTTDTYFVLIKYHAYAIKDVS